jgi:cytidylate kinase
MNKTRRIIAIDGPSGAGKSTIARLTAQRLGLRYLDTGAMYRAVTLHCMRSRVRLDDPKAVAGALATLVLRVELVLEGPMKVFLGDEEVTGKIRTLEVTRNIHHVADVVEVRDKLVAMQREIGEQGDLVTEGRDQGSLVFPDAVLKVYMYASPEVRARRRHQELADKSVDVTYAEILQDVSQRDHHDQNREVGALRRAADAVELDTSDMTLEQVADEIVRLANPRLGV